MVPDASVAVPVNVRLLVGSVIVWAEPALTTGAELAAGFTVIVTVADPVRLLLLVTFS